MSGAGADLPLVPSPALVVDAEAAERNHARAMDLLGHGQWLRPHFKAHKTTSLAALQRGEGVRGPCCQTSWEALVLARAGFDDIMVTNQIASPMALDELAAASRSARLSVLVDDLAHLPMLETAARTAGSTIGVLVEIETGMNRCGVAPDSAAMAEIAASVASSDSLVLDGIQAYDGHTTSIAEPRARREMAIATAAIAAAARERLRSEGFDISVVAGCSTAHLPFVAELDVFTDIQAGSYLLMDSIYAGFPDLPFEPALWLEATVIHRSPGRFVLDAGVKELTADSRWAGDPTARTRLSDEHCVVATSQQGLTIGDRTRLVPSHVDPTVNLHETVWISRGGVARAARVDGRRAAFAEGTAFRLPASP